MSNSVDESTTRSTPVAASAAPAPTRLTALSLLTGAPGTPAVDTPSGVLDRGQLAERVAEFSAWLDQQGVHPASTVLVEAERCVSFLPLLLACWQRGTVTGIVDRALPAQVRTERAALLGAAHRIDVTDAACRVSAASEGRSGRTTAVPQSAQHVLFTSGSTGVPKTVAVSATALFGALEDYLEAYRPSSEDRFALVSGIGHDPVLRDGLVPLLCGARVAVPPPEAMAEPRALYRFLRDARVTVLHAAPGLLELIVAGSAGDGLPDLRLVISGGDALRAGTVRALQGLGGAEVYNAYGCTEYAQIASACRVDDTVLDGLSDTDRVPIGDRFGRTRVRVLARDGRPAPVGELGELVIDGPHLGLGQGSPGTGPVHTGDMGRRVERGLIHLTGRSDRRVSVDGHRVAPEEIENAALEHEDCRAVWAGPWSYGDEPEALTLAVCPDHDLRSDAFGTLESSLRNWLRARLPSHVVPARILLVENFRMSVNHKVVGPGRLLGRDAGADARPEADPVEQVILDMIRQQTGLSLPPGRNFFDGGLTSLQLVRLHASLQTALRRRFPVIDLFAHPNTAELTKSLTSGHRSTEAPRRLGTDRHAKASSTSRRERLYEELEKNSRG
ncbi:AMP-binding protein [Streptomyces sp. NPDC018045]|uniref:AMP-binding protein n=1 Tax=Streptomyces sp. NPDC018045 TaxID=3365037 RepID=UPI0037B02472